MLENIFVNMLTNTDLNLYHCGSENCAPGHSYGPAIRDHYLIHYILDGKGFFQVNNKTYHLKNGQGFLICPDIITYYEADKENPGIMSRLNLMDSKQNYTFKMLI